MAATAVQMQAEIVAMAQRLQLAEQQGVRLASELEQTKAQTDDALKRAHEMIKNLEQARAPDKDRMDLVDVKSMAPQSFGGKREESYKQWAKKVKAYCNARRPGFRQALEWAEAEVTPIDQATLGNMNWAFADIANSKLFDLLVMHLYDDPLILVENHANQGFEAWRALSRRYDPVCEQFTFDRMTSLLTRKRCKDIGELPAAIERWNRDLGLYERKTGNTLEKEWRVPIIFQMIPEANYTEIKTRWQMNKDKDITTFAQDLIAYANDLKHDSNRGRGSTPMDVDALAKANGEEPTEDEWPEYPPEFQAMIVWMGKAKGKGGKGYPKGGKGGKAGKGKGDGCHWCGEEGHVKADCRKFKKWKQDKDDERKKQGLPPFKPRGLASLDEGSDGQDDYTEHLREAGAGMLDVGMLDHSEPGCCALGLSNEASEHDSDEDNMDDEFETESDKDESDGEAYTEKDLIECDMLDEHDPEGFWLDAHVEQDQSEWQPAASRSTSSRRPIAPQPVAIKINNMFDALEEPSMNSAIKKKETLAETFYREQQELLSQLSQGAHDVQAMPRLPLIPPQLPKVPSGPAGMQRGRTVPPPTVPPPRPTSDAWARRRRPSSRTIGISQAYSGAPPGFEGRSSPCSLSACGGCDGSAEQWESALTRCQPKPIVKAELQDTGSQTEIQLAHTVRSITWVPVTESLDVVTEGDDLEMEEFGESHCIEDIKGDVNDVDSVSVLSEGSSASSPG